MKRNITVILAMMCALISLAQSIEIDGITYTGHKMGTYRYASISGIATENGENILSEVEIAGNTYFVSMVDAGEANKPSLTCSGSTLVLPRSISIIGDYAFSGSIGAVTLVIPEEVESIGNNILQGSSIKTLRCNAVNCRDFGSLVSGGSSAISEVVIGDEVQYVPANFLNFNVTSHPVKSLVVGRSVTEIGANAIKPAIKLESVDYRSSYMDENESLFPATVKNLTLAEGITRIPANFLSTSSKVSGNLTSLTLPTTLESIGANAFSYQKGLKGNIFINGNVDEGAFSYTGLTSATVNGDVGTRAFFGAPIVAIIVNGNITGPQICEPMSYSNYTDGRNPSTDRLRLIYVNGEVHKNAFSAVIQNPNQTNPSAYIYKYFNQVNSLYIGPNIKELPSGFPALNGKTNVYLSENPPLSVPTNINATYFIPKGCADKYAQVDFWQNKTLIELDYSMAFPGGGTGDEGQVRLSTSISDNVAVHHSTHRKGETAIVEVHPPAGWQIGKAEFNGEDVLGDFDGGTYVTRPLTEDSQMNVELAYESPFEVIDATTEITSLPESNLCIERNGDCLNLYGLSAGDTVTLYTISGMKLMEHTVAGDTISVNIAGRDTGVYVIAVNGKGYKIRF